jgi:inosose dehydratase
MRPTDDLPHRFDAKNILFSSSSSSSSYRPDPIQRRRVVTETTPGATSLRTPRIAVNPIPYWSRNGKIDKSKEAFDQAFTDLADIGFTAVKADVPKGMSSTEYADWIGSYGLAPSLGLFSSPFDETIDIVEEIERAKRFAADHLSLGLDRTMVSSMAIPARMAQPAVGADFDKDRFELAVENCGIICQVLQGEGLRPLHHSHVGGVFETEDEIVRLLDTLGPNVIGVGPDTGHLRWAGIDPATFIRRYADRIGGIHIKDCFADYLDPAARTGMGYRELSASKRLWAEAGRGVVDFDAVIAAMPEDYDGDFMVEVDEPSVESRRESHKLLFDWARQTLSFARI